MAFSLPVRGDLYLAFACVFLVIVARALLKEYLNPLNRYPGPIAARWTRCYMAYYDIVKGGAWIEHLRELHCLYGPVVRVAPNELHFSDSQAYGDIYSAASKVTKDWNLYGAFPQEESMFTQTDLRKAAMRRSLITPFFSRQTVLSQVESTIRSTVDKLIHQLVQNHFLNQTPANLNHALRSTTFDIITTYCFSTSSNAVSSPGFHSDILLGMDAALPSIPLGKHFRIFKLLIQNIPKTLVPMLSASLKTAAKQIQDVEAIAEKVLLDPNAGDFTNRTIFHSLLENAESGEIVAKRASLPLNRKWLTDEGVVLRFAGSDTVSSACVVGCRYLLADPIVLGKLVKELDSAWPDVSERLKVEMLEKLPYLTAVIKESLRLSHGVTSPMIRVVGSGGATIAGHSVPEGTSVAITNSFVHLNPEIFPEPERFLPERWLQPNSSILEKYLVAFGKGPRSCLGINLAWCEMYLIMGSIFKKLKLTPTVDVRSPWRAKDCFLPLYPNDFLLVYAEERSQ